MRFSSYNETLKSLRCRQGIQSKGVERAQTLTLEKTKIDRNRRRSNQIQGKAIRIHGGLRFQQTFWGESMEDGCVGLDFSRTVFLSLSLSLSLSLCVAVHHHHSPKEDESF
ncbi:hypothetical protein PanWU01x14_252040, partial [Parasponia andersonii]